jgi:hypothetical protein
MSLNMLDILFFGLADHGTGDLGAITVVRDDVGAGFGGEFEGRSERSGGDRRGG